MISIIGGIFVLLYSCADPKALRDYTPEMIPYRLSFREWSRGDNIMISDSGLYVGLVDGDYNFGALIKFENYNSVLSSIGYGIYEQQNDTINVSLYQPFTDKCQILNFKVKDKSTLKLLNAKKMKLPEYFVFYDFSRPIRYYQFGTEYNDNILKNFRNFWVTDSDYYDYKSSIK
ncbi:MAG: hypothetical protein HDR49_03730 [Bacteroides sp.]|nr:hypothetical protein [Bacteroides sp.]